MRRQHLLTVVLTLALWLPAATGQLHAGESIAYRLKWLLNTSVVGDLYAASRGYFQNAGLDVEVKPGGPERDAIRELELGYAQFGVASADQVIRGLSKGAPVIVLAQLFQINPLQWIYRTDQPPINTLADLKGRTLGITYGGNDEYIMRALLAKGGIRESEVQLYSVRYDFTPFYQRKADIWPVYRNSQGPILREKLEEAGEGVRFFNPADFGVRFVANSVITSADMAAGKPETVRAFTTALLAAWRDALKPENASLALETLAQYDKDTPDALRRVQLKITRDLIQPAPDTDVGAIDIPGWRQTEAIMLEQKLIPEPVHVERVLNPRL